MTPKTLRVRAVAGAHVQHFERLDSGANRERFFIGRRFTAQPGEDGDQYPITGEVEEVRYRAEYIKALKDGDLEPADAETAKAAGVKFESASASARHELPPPPLTPSATHAEEDPHA